MVGCRFIHLAVVEWWPVGKGAIAEVRVSHRECISCMYAILRGMDAILVDDDGWCCKGEILQTHEGYSG